MEFAGFDICALKNKVPDEGGFSLLRPLDCAVITHLHSLMKKEGVSFDTVYGYFQEGKEAFPGAGVREKSHIQICVKNLSCIKGYFIPKKIVQNWHIILTEPRAPLNNAYHAGSFNFWMNYEC